MADVDHLYALPLEEFIPGRDAAAKQLRKAGDRDTAAVVAKLAKPTPAAWTANQVAREQPELIEAMLEAGAELRTAQEAAVSGGGGRGLRDATVAERRAVDAVMAAATEYRPAGRALSRALADRLRTTLHAAATDDALREALAHGRLVDEAQAGGAWPFALEPAPREAKAAPKKSSAKTAGESGADEERAATKPGAAEADGESGAGTERAATKPGATERGAKGRAATKPGATERGAKGRAATKPGATERGAKGRAATEPGAADSGGGKGRAATKRGDAGRRAPTPPDDADRAAEERRAEAEREAAARKALEDELREARGSLRVRERVFAGAEEDAAEAGDAVNQARAALEQAQKAAEDAVAEAEAAERVLTEARRALDQARDAVARLEERLD